MQYLLIILSLFLFSCGSDNVTKIELSETELSIINNSKANGGIKIEPHNTRFQVHPDYWNGLDMSMKEGLSKVVAKYIAKKRDTDLIWCDIYDMYSGKKIAKYSNSWGFKIY